MIVEAIGKMPDFGRLLLASILLSGCTRSAARRTDEEALSAPVRAAPGPLVFGGAAHRVYLGCFCERDVPDSMFNPKGPHGNKRGSASIWNQDSEHGALESSTSACNQAATNPPIVLHPNGKTLGRLTRNASLRDAIRAEEVLWMLEGVCSGAEPETVGCCSRHGGDGECERGRVRCSDGTVSPCICMY